MWLLREQSISLWSSPSLSGSQVPSWEVTDGQPSPSMTMMVELLYYFTPSCLQHSKLSLSLILFAVVSVEFADRSIEVSEGVGEVSACLLKNSTTAMDFSVTVASVESSPVSAEGL